MVIDTFTRPKAAQHPDATTDWLNNLVGPKTQADFTLLKSSIAPNQDVPVSTYSMSIQQRASGAFKTLRVVPSSIHGALRSRPCRRPSPLADLSGCVERRRRVPT
jgi:hypothetical protein